MDFLKKIYRAAWNFFIEWGKHKAKLAMRHQYFY
jgi:hypothetical protein